MTRCFRPRQYPVYYTYFYDTNMEIHDSESNNSDNLAIARETSVVLYNEDYSVGIKLVYVLSGIVAMVTSATAIVILQRTKRIPKAAKYLSKWLMIFDMLYIVSTSIRTFILEPGINQNLQILSTVFIQWAYLTICIMSVDRLIVFNWPNLYIKRFTERLLRNIMIIVLVVHFFTYYFLRYVVCYFKYRSTVYLVQAGLCHEVMYAHNAVVLFLMLTIPTVCYFKIFRIVRRTMSTAIQKKSFLNATKEIRGYKMTSIVLVFVIVTWATTLAFLIVLIIRGLRLIQVTEFRLVIETVAYINCFIDPILYVFWFRESQMELLKLMCSWSPVVSRKVEAMRMQIFSIVKSESLVQRSDQQCKEEV